MTGEGEGGEENCHMLTTSPLNEGAVGKKLHTSQSSDPAEIRLLEENLSETRYTAVQVMEDIVNISKDHKELLKHSMCIALLKRKWRKLEFLYYGWMLTKVIFPILLISVATIEGPFLKDCLRKIKQNTTEENTPVFRTSNASLHYLLVPFTIFLSLFYIVELLQMGISVKW